ncbi:MAG: hypothetical protein V3T70_03365 [Phycisphaerae bacterium]
MMVAALTRKRLLIGAVAAVIAILAVKKAVYDRYAEVVANEAKLKKRHHDLNRKAAAHRRLIKQWQDYGSRTYAAAEARNHLDLLVKQLLAKSGLKGPDVKTTVSGKLAKTQVRRLVCAVKIETELHRLIDFLWILYQEPVLLKVSRMNLRPVDEMGGSSRVKVDLDVESLVFTKDKSAPPVIPTPADEFDELDPIRVPAFARREYAEIAERNIFAAYEPPPHVAVRITNEDRLPITVAIQPVWQDKQGASRKYSLDGDVKHWEAPEPVTGNRVLVTATYADGQTYKAKEYVVRKRFTQNVQRFDLRIPAHSPPPDPTDVIVTVQNDDEATVELSVELEMDGKMIKLAAISIKPGRKHKLQQWETQRVQLLATYDGGGVHGPTTFTPMSERPMKWVIPPKPLAETSTPTVVDTAPPADPNLRVTGLWTSKPQEFIATHQGTRERQTFALLDKVDGGDLVFVHSLGAIVKMPDGGYYLYPYGAKFTDRAALGVRAQAELPAALMTYRTQMMNNGTLVVPVQSEAAAPRSVVRAKPRANPRANVKARPSRTKSRSSLPGRRSRRVSRQDDDDKLEGGPK